MGEKAPLKTILVKYDEDAGKIKVARYQGELLQLTVMQGCVAVGTLRYFVSNNLLDGSIVQVNVVPSKERTVAHSLLVRDILKYGSGDLSGMSHKARFELLDLLCSTFSDEYGFKLFGGRCVGPYVYVALPITFSLAYKCQDERLIGVTVNGEEDVLKSDVVDVDVDGPGRWPPVPDEGKRAMAYKPLIQMMIHKMTGKWRDVRLKRHTPGQLPFSAEDLMQQGMMEVIIALRKYNASHNSKAKESTFVYKHVWNRFGHIAHKYSKKSRGYGVQIVRDTYNEDGSITTPYDLGVESASHGYLGNTDPDRD